MTVQDVTLAFGGDAVLEGVSLNIEAGMRACVTGRNGEGKSTLLKVIAGRLEPDTGEIVRAPSPHKGRSRPKTPWMTRQMPKPTDKPSS